MTENEVRERAFAMPIDNPAYPPGPYRFVDREYLIITYRTDPAMLAAMAAPNYLLKIIPHVDGTPRICEIVRYCLTDIHIKGAWAGPGALDLHDHALAPVADLPVLEVLSTIHIIADLTLPLGEVVHDYFSK